MPKAKVILFKESGKYYTEEEWEIPSIVEGYSPQRGNYKRGVIGPYDMLHSPDFRRIGHGSVLVETQEPWGYPHLFPNEFPDPPTHDFETCADPNICEDHRID